MSKQGCTFPWQSKTKENHKTTIHSHTETISELWFDVAVEVEVGMEVGTGVGVELEVAAETT